MYLWISLFSLFIRLFLLFSPALLRVRANVCKARVEPVYEAKIFSTFLMLPLKNPLRNLDGFCSLVFVSHIDTVRRDFPWIPIFICLKFLIQLLNISFEVTVIYIEFALRCFSSFKYTHFTSMLTFKRITSSSEWFSTA